MEEVSVEIGMLSAVAALAWKNDRRRITPLL
jgi:hypothetical protein